MAYAWLLHHFCIEWNIWANPRIGCLCVFVCVTERAYSNIPTLVGIYNNLWITPTHTHTIKCMNQVWRLTVITITKTPLHYTYTVHSIKMELSPSVDFIRFAWILFTRVNHFDIVHRIIRSFYLLKLNKLQYIILKAC